MHSWQNGTRCRDGVKILWYRFHLVNKSFRCSANSVYFIKRPCLNVLFHVDNLFTIGDRYCQKSESAFHFYLCRNGL